MTLVAMCSAKGSPGVTTLACVMGATWPAHRQVLIAELDPGGGDIAARFGLSTRVGTTSFVLACRRAAAATSDTGTPLLQRHVQLLPGGLPVLASPIGADAAGTLDRELAATCDQFADSAVDVIADCGRLVPTADGQRGILRRADAVVLVCRHDVASLAQARWAAERLAEWVPGMVSLVLRGAPRQRADEASALLGLDVLGIVPEDSAAAGVACGALGAQRSFARSGLVAAAAAISNRMLAVASSVHDDAAVPSVGDRAQVQDAAPQTLVARMGSRLRRGSVNVAPLGERPA